MMEKKEYIFSNTVLITEETSVMANSYEEAEDILDNPMKNIDLMHENCNQFKSNDTGDKLLLRLETELNQTITDESLTKFLENTNVLLN